MNAAAGTGSPAGFWKRYVAYSIDLFLVCVVLELLSRIFFHGTDAHEIAQLETLLTSMQSPEAVTEDRTAALMQVASMLWQMMASSTLAYAVTAGAYFIACESSHWEATLGKRLVGIKVVAADGSRAGPGRAAGRFFAAALSWLTLNLGHVLAAWTSERRALHDFLADTRVVNAEPAHPGMPPWGWLIIGAQGLLFLIVIVVAMVAMQHAMDAAAQI